MVLFLLSILVIMIVVFIMLGISLLAKYRRLLQFRNAMSYTFQNENTCPCENGSGCRLLVLMDQTLPPDFETSQGGFDRALALYSANLLAVTEAPWAYEQDDKTVFPLPTNVQLDSVVKYEGETFGAIFREGQVLIVTFRKIWTFLALEESMLGQETFLGHKDMLVQRQLLQMYNKIKSQILARIIGNKEASILVTGHSTGGALASLLHLDLANRGFGKVTSYTFGSPRVGNIAVAERLDALARCVRVANDADIVCSMPLATMPNIQEYDLVTTYQHGGQTERFVDTRGSLAECHSLRTYMDFLVRETPKTI